MDILGEKKKIAAVARSTDDCTIKLVHCMYRYHTLVIDKLLISVPIWCIRTQWRTIPILPYIAEHILVVAIAVPHLC